MGISINLDEEIVTTLTLITRPRSQLPNTKSTISSTRTFLSLVGRQYTQLGWRVFVDYRAGFREPQEGRGIACGRQGEV